MYSLVASQWVNRGTNAVPTSGQANPYTLFSHDLNGRMTRRERKYSSTLTRVYDFLWDGDDRLKQVKEGADSRLIASYDGGGLRVSKWDFWTGQHDFSWGPGGVLHDSSGSTTYTPGAAHRSNNVDRFYHTDWIGSSRYLSDGSGNSFPSALRYDAFGQRSATSGPDHPTDFLFGAAHGYQTEYQTATEPGLGLQYLQQRWYDPATGRFISADPLGFVAGLNLYLYPNDPVNAVDPSGLEAEGLDDVENYQQLIDQARRDFANEPRNRPGSPERREYSRKLDTIPFVAEAKQLYQFFTGRDPVAGTSASRWQLATIGPVGPLTVIRAIRGARPGWVVKGRRYEKFYPEDIPLYRGPSAWYKSEGEARRVALQKLGKNPVMLEPGKWRSADGRWQYRAQPGDLNRPDPHVHIERIDPVTGQVLQNWHLRFPPSSKRP